MNRPAKNAAEAIAHIRSGRRAMIITYTHATVLDENVLRRFENRGLDLLKDCPSGKGILVRHGRRFDYLFENQLVLENA